MKVLVLSSLDNISASSVRSEYLGYLLHKREQNVDLVVPNTDAKKIKEIQLKRGFNKILIPQRRTPFGFISSTINRLMYCLKTDYDIVLLQKPYPMGVIPAFILKYIKGIPLVMDWDDYEYALFNKSKMGFLIKIFENFGLKHSDAVITHSHYLVKLLKKWGINNFFVIPNGIITKYYNVKKNKIKSIKKRLEFNNVLSFAFISTMVESSELDYVIDSIRNVKSKNFKLVIFGSGPRLKYFKEEIKKLKLEDKAIFLNRVPDNNFLTFVSSCDCGIQYMRQSPYNEARYPMKLINYMGCGLLIVCNDVGETKFLINNERGLIMKGDNIKSFTELIDYTIRNYKKLKIKGIKAKKYVFENLNEDKVSDELLKAVKYAKKHN